MCIYIYIYIYIYTHIYSCNAAKDVTGFTNFPANKFILGVRKKHLHCIIFRRPRTAFSKHFQSKCLYIPVCLRKKIFVQVLTDEWPKDFLTLACCCLNLVGFFILIDTFGNSIVFLVFRYFHQ